MEAEGIGQLCRVQRKEVAVLPRRDPGEVVAEGGACRNQDLEAAVAVAVENPHRDREVEEVAMGCQVLEAAGVAEAEVGIGLESQISPTALRQNQSDQEEAAETVTLLVFSRTVRVEAEGRIDPAVVVVLISRAAIPSPHGPARAVADSNGVQATIPSQPDLDKVEAANSGDPVGITDLGVLGTTGRGHRDRVRVAAGNNGVPVTIGHTTRIVRRAQIAPTNGRTSTTIRPRIGTSGSRTTSRTLTTSKSIEPISGIPLTTTTIRETGLAGMDLEIIRSGATMSGIIARTDARRSGIREKTIGMTSSMTIGGAPARGARPLPLRLV